MHSPSLASERAERTPARAEGTRIERHEVRLAAEASMQPPTNARMPTLHFARVCVCVCAALAALLLLLPLVPIGRRQL